MEKPMLSEHFDVDDIRKIREYNSLRHIGMTPDEIVEDIKKGAAGLLAGLRKDKSEGHCLGKR
nr:hypothetical protein [uncultured Acetatifactor sp.]